MDDPTYPRRSAHFPAGQIIAVDENTSKFPAYKGLPILDIDGLKKAAQEQGGYVMQKDDGYLPAFCLYNYAESRA